MLTMKTIVLMLVIILLNGCGDSSDNKKETAKKPLADNPLQGHLKTIDKAKDAQKKVKEAAEKQRKAIEEATEKKKQSDKG